MLIIMLIDKKTKLKLRKNTFISDWWKTVDKLILILSIFLVFFGFIISFSVSTSIAERIGLDPYYFINRHLIFMIISIGLIISISFFSLINIRYLTIINLIFGIIGLVFVLFYGNEIKGAKRWITIFQTSIQPSELIKPSIAVLIALLFSKSFLNPKFPANFLCLSLIFVCISLILPQPDIGLSIVILINWLSMIFISGMQIMWIILVLTIGILGLIISYFIFPHVKNRINHFINHNNSDYYDSYQINQSLEAFSNGGWFGVGFGEGTIKKKLPDAHTDFIFSVIGEEFGLITCLLILGIFIFIIIRSITKVIKSNNIFSIFSILSLLTQIWTQIIINIGSSLHMIPTKGITMPFVSYGGSSLISISISIGMILSIIRRRNKELEDKYNILR